MKTIALTVFLIIFPLLTFADSYTVRNRVGTYQGKVIVNGNRISTYDRSGAYSGKVIQQRSTYKFYDKSGSYQGRMYGR